MKVGRPSKLDLSTFLKIKEYKLKNPQASQSEIAEVFGVSQPFISLALKVLFSKDEDYEKLKRAIDLSAVQLTEIKNAKVTNKWYFQIPKQIMLQHKKPTKKSKKCELIDLSIRDLLYYIQNKKFPIDTVPQKKGVEYIPLFIEDIEIAEIKYKNNGTEAKLKIINFDKDKQLEEGMIINGVCVEYTIGTRGSGVTFDTAYCLKEFEVISRENNFFAEVYNEMGVSEMPKKNEIDEKLIEKMLKADFDLQKAIRGVNICYVGDDDVKEILLYAYASFDKDYVQQSVVPIILRAKSGAGKCVVGDTLILTDNGLIPIKNLVKTTNPIKVATFSENGDISYAFSPLRYNVFESDVIRIKTKCGYELTGTPEHKILVLGKDGKLSWKSLYNITIGEQVLLIKGIYNSTNNPKFSNEKIEFTPKKFPNHPNIKMRNLVCYSKKVNIPNEINSELARFLGYVISEGNIIGNYIRITNKDKQIIKDFKHLSKKLFDTNISICHHGWRPPTIQICSKHIANFMRTLGLGTSSDKKEIPEIIFRSKKDVVTNFLKGLFSGDGYAYPQKLCVEYYSKSKKLVDGIQQLLLHLNIIATKHNKKNKDNEYWRLSIFGDNAKKFAETIGFIGKNQKNICKALKKDKGKRYVSVGSINLREALLEIYKKQISHYYVNFDRNITQTTLLKIISNIKEIANSKIISQLEMICKDYMFFDKIVEKKNMRDNVYDITIPTTHSYISNGFVSHNTVFLEGLTISMNAEIFGANDITPASLGMIRQNELIEPELTPVVLFDEIDKFSSENIPPLLTYFGAETKHRIRYGIKFEKQSKVWAIGTILTGLEMLSKSATFERKKYGLEQIMRRSVILYLSAEQPEEQKQLTERIIEEETSRYTKRYEITKEDKEALNEFIKATIRAYATREFMKNKKCEFEFRNKTEFVKQLEECSKYFFLGEDLAWDRTIQRLLLRLCMGRALVNVRTTLFLEDLEYIFEILYKHAKTLGYIRGDENMNKIKLIQLNPENMHRGKCDYCGHKAYLKYKDTEGNLVCRECGEEQKRL